MRILVRAVIVGAVVACALAGTALRAFADAPGISVQALSPANATVYANDRITFVVTASNFFPQSYVLTDSYRNSSVASSNISGAGNFFWVPIASDAGTHVLSITARDGSGNAASITQTVTVLPLPSIVLTSITPGGAVMPGSKFSFIAVSTGFTSPRFTVSDAFSGSSAVLVPIGASGLFSWTPDLTQQGLHTLTVYASDSSGHSASVQQYVQVGGGPSLNIMLLEPGSTVPVGTTTTFLVTSSNFSPTAFSVGDSFPGSTLNNGNISTAGAFRWAPQQSDVGVHLLTIRGTLGNYGASATTSLKLVVTGAAASSAAAPVAATAPGAAGPSNAPAAGGYVFNNFMGYGEGPGDGPDVLELQKRLATLGFFSVEPNGYFGPVTQLSVKKFQGACGIAATGYVGPLTRAALNK